MRPIRTLRDLNREEIKCRCQTEAAGVVVTFHIQAHGEQVDIPAKVCELCDGVRAVDNEAVDRAIELFTLH